LSWGWKELQPLKWFPIYWPNAEWRVIPSPPTPGVAQQPPNGAILQWWELPKDQWPLQAPWGEKSLGAWPASKLMMSEDFVNNPPFGYIKLKMPRQIIASGHQISFFNMKMHMRPDFGPINHMKLLTRDTPMGTKFYLIDQNWDYAEYDYKKYREALRARKMEKYMEQLGLEIANYDGKPKPSRDLFS
jgi:hypothetical protein